MTPVAEKIIKKYYKEKSDSYIYLYKHSCSVESLAVKIAQHNEQYSPNIEFIKTAAMLHDIGIFMTNAPGIGCFGKYPYIAHGYLGRELLEKENLKEIAPVCERHVGLGITVKDIISENLPLPKRNMVPVSIEEQIVCYADKFYSKKPKYLIHPKPLEKIRNKARKYGPEKAAIFEEFVNKFGSEYIYE